MLGCTLQDAFPMDGAAPSPGCGEAYSTKEARREERKKARRCRGPAMEFLGVKDPDRQHLNKLPEVPAMNSATGLREHVPVEAPQGYEPFTVNSEGQRRQVAPEAFADIGAGKSQQQQRLAAMESFVDREQSNSQSGTAMDTRQRLRDLLPRSDDDPVGDKVRSIIPTMPTAASGPKKSFFGADPDEPFANYTPDVDNFLMEPTIENGFGLAGGMTQPSGNAALPVPSVSDYWKPLTPAGAETAFFKALPAPGGTYSRRDIARGQTPIWPEDDLSRKIDKIMARLDDLQRSKAVSPEQAQTEIMMFVSSGVLVLFLMDLLVKKGGRLF
jgi:hypothetical protein